MRVCYTYFYRHRLAEALPHAKACLAEAARRLNVAADWRLVSPSDANFTEIEPGPRLFLFSLLAYGYVLTRLDRVAEGRPILEKVSELDPADRMGARAILALLDRRGVEDDD